MLKAPALMLQLGMVLGSGINCNHHVELFQKQGAMVTRL